MIPKRDTYRCDRCGRLFVMDLDPVVRCAFHSEDDECHVGEIVIDRDGRVAQWIASTDCLPYATH